MLVGLVGIVGAECRCYCLRSFGAMDVEAVVEMVVVDEGEDFLVRVV